jgi:hypothetical protein
LNAATFLTLNEKRAAVGYAPVDFGEGPPGEAGVKYSPDQPRVPAGNEDGGQWTDGGGGGGGASSSGRVRVAQADTGALNDAGEQERFIQLAQAGGGRGSRSSPILARFPTATPAQEARLAIAEVAARNLREQVRSRDPKWKPTPSLTSTIEGAISAAEAEAREARSRLSEIAGGGSRSEAQPSTLRNVCTVEGNTRTIGRKSKGSGLDTLTVTREEFDRLLLELPRGATEVEAPSRYKGIWYKRSDGTTIGVRRSEKHGLTIDIIDSLGDPLVRSDTRIHSDD